MDALTPGSRAAAHLLDRKELLARAITEALYGDMPELLERYGERGREKCLQDHRYTLEHLIPAVELESPVMFGEYVRWLDGLLRARHVPTAELVRSLMQTCRVLERELPADEAAAVAPVLQAGLAILHGAEAT